MAVDEARDPYLSLQPCFALSPPRRARSRARTGLRAHFKGHLRAAFGRRGAGACRARPAPIPWRLWRIVHDECVPHVEGGGGTEALRARRSRGRRGRRESRSSRTCRRCADARDSDPADHRHRRPADARARCAATFSPTPGRPRRWSRRGSAARCRARRSGSRSIRNGRAARSKCTSMSIARPVPVVKALAEYAPAIDDTLARDDGSAPGTGLFRAPGRLGRSPRRRAAAPARRRRRGRTGANGRL